MDAGFFKTLKSFKLTSRKYRIADDDWADRLNHHYTPLLFVIFSAIVAAKTYIVGQPLQCWVPAYFTGGWEQYAENYCWVKNTYFADPLKEITSNREERRGNELTYYQWVPFVLAIQAICFGIPSWLWSSANGATGIQIAHLVDTAFDASGLNPGKWGADKKDKTIDDLRAEGVEVIVKYIERGNPKLTDRKKSLLVKVKQYIFNALSCGKAKTGNFLMLMYITTKLCYIANIIGQFALMGAFLKSTYGGFFGAAVLHDLAKGREWHESGHFPRVTFCDFAIRTLGNIQSHTIQCVLVINLFTEKIYIFLWFWCLIVAIATLINAASWIMWALVPSHRIPSIVKAVQARRNEGDLRGTPEIFVRETLRLDDFLVLNIIAQNAGESIAADIVAKLYENHLQRER